MNGTAHNRSLMQRMNRLSWPLWCGLLGLLLAPGALATDPIYVNSTPQYYAIPGNNPPPQVDATAFDNESPFNISFSTYSSIPIIYETQNTLFFTNNDTMTVNSPLTLNNFFLASSFICGFQFDQRTPNGRLPANTFYNPGTIRCDSLLDGNNVLNVIGFNFFIQTSVGECFVSATNIINSGTILASLNGLIQLSGQNVDLTRGIIILEQGTLTNSDSGISSLAGGFGTDTNLDWDPGFDLTATSAVSSYPYIVNLTNSTSYFDIVTPNATNVVVRAVFIQNSIPNVTNQVYFGNNLVGNGTATVEWDGAYVDPATGQTRTNYLYLFNDYAQGASTNVFLANGIPSNFQFVQGGPLYLGIPTTPGFQDIFALGAITNPYSYASVQFIASTVATNVTLSNPYGSLTNLPGRIQISASRKLNLALANISGPNYMSLTCTNQFDGNVGAQISSAYSDINLGVTNGFLTISNLLESAIPKWNGPIQAWSTRWFYTDPTSGITYDYRVMLVNSTAVPTTSAQVQDLTLHSTNLVISDVLNVMRTLSIDAKSLTLTTNGYGAGSGSPQGELNWNNGGPNNTLGASQLPNLRWLTNNGAIRTLAAANLGSAAPNNYQAIVNNGLMSFQGLSTYASYFENSGIITNGSGSFVLQSQAAVLTNGFIYALGGDVSITTSSLMASNLVLQAGRSLTLRVTNLLTDNGVTNGNIWSVGGSSSVGLNLPIKPLSGDLLGTTITNIAPAGKNVANTWAATNVGVSAVGYTNNAAVGRLILDALGFSSQFTFNGTGTNNAIYVDYLELRDYATNYLNQNVTALNINPNLVIYYAQAFINGVSVAEKLNGYNANHLRWVGAYAGHFSSTNLVYPDGTTNTFNSALTQSKNIDSDGDGIVNGNDPTPFFVPGNMNFALLLTNLPPLKVQLTWQTMPSATNSIYYTTNLTSANWLLLTNFVTPPAPPYAPITTNVLDSVNPAQARFYRVQVNGNAANLYGP